MNSQTGRAGAPHAHGIIPGSWSGFLLPHVSFGMSWCLGVHHWACAETSQSSGAPEKGTISSAAIARPHTCKESLNWLREVGHRLPAPVFPQLCLHLSLHHPPAKPCLPVPRTWAFCAPPTQCLCGLPSPQLTLVPPPNFPHPCTRPISLWRLGSLQEQQHPADL